MAMQSHQETVLEHLMSHSFGTTEIYVPTKIRKGKGGHREPADLAWINNDTAILFYMNRSVHAFKKQADHNVRQANGFLRLWATAQPLNALRGKNRFGTVGYFPWASIRNIFLVSVVSGNVGFAHHQDPMYLARYPDKRVLCCSMNEKAIGRLASLSASIVDFVSLIENHSANEMLSIEDIDDYVDWYSTVGYQELTRYLAKTGQTSDAIAVTRYLNILKPASPEGIILNGPLRKLFCDLSLYDRSCIVATTLQAIEASGPPNFHGMVAIYTPFCWHQIICVAASIANSGVDEFLKELLEKRSEPQHRETVVIWWGNLIHALDHRSPTMLLDPIARAEYSQLNYVVDCVFDQNHRQNNPKVYNNRPPL
jgi:hypothetical protein